MRLMLKRTDKTVLIIIIVPLTLFPLYQVLIVLPDSYTVNLCVFYFDRLIRKLIVFLQQLQEFISETDRFFAASGVRKQTPSTITIT